jgi:predicted HicB family RNase H-like nuclease
MGRNASYHLSAIESTLDPSSNNDLYFGQNINSEEEQVSEKSSDILMECNGYLLEGVTELNSDFVTGRIRTPSGRLVSNYSPRTTDVEDLKRSFCLYLDQLYQKIESHFQANLNDGKISGKIALRINAELHCQLNIESTYQDKTLNSYIEEIATHRMTSSNSTSLKIDDGNSTSLENQTTTAKKVCTSEGFKKINKNSLSSKLAQDPVASLKMIASLGKFARKEGFSLLSFSGALADFIEGMSFTLENTLLPHLEENIDSNAELLKALGNMLIDAADTL